MKLKYVFIALLTIGLFASCKSKKKTITYKYPPKKETVKTPEVVVEEEVIVVEEVEIPIINSTEQYILVFKDIAMEEMRVYKIPASITLAQGILESSSGTSALTLRSNNHFGIKCHKGWEGDSTLHDDDEKGECFRVYTDPRNSYIDHSKFLTSRSRYAGLFELDEGDYVGWAEGLSAAGYATDRRYPAKLIALIEKYNLHQYDAEVLGNSYKKPIISKSETYTVSKGDTLYSISKKYGLTVDHLKKINGLKSNEISIGQALLVK
jgi:flagellum-specific peptidoglycan hydrolase FlgJ